MRSSAPQRLACSVGAPVEPDVKTKATVRSTGSAGIAPAADDGSRRPIVVCGRSMCACGSSVRQYVAGKARDQRAQRRTMGRRRQQAHLAAQHRRGEADREAIAVGAHVQHVAAIGQSFGQQRRLGEEASAGHRPPATPREHRVVAVEAVQQRCGRVHGQRCRNARTPVISDPCSIPRSTRKRIAYSAPNIAATSGHSARLTYDDHSARDCVR